MFVCTGISPQGWRAKKTFNHTITAKIARIPDLGLYGLREAYNSSTSTTVSGQTEKDSNVRG